MPGFDHSVLTDVGWDALTDAEAGQHIEYTHLEAGDGFVYGGDTEIFGMTNLVNKIMDFPITNFSNDGQGQITLVGVISSKNVTTGFNFREIGVRCTIDGGSSILYAVANSGDEADYIPSSAESGVVIQTVQIIIKIDRATNVTVIIQPGLDVTAQNIGPGTVGPGWFRDKQSQILWFKRLNSPKKTIDLIETSDLISIDVPTIDVDLDMFVALGNPDIFPNFSTIQKALDYLTPFSIKVGKTVTIKVSAGTWHNHYVNVKHIQSSQIKIIGTIGTTQPAVTSAVWTGDRVVRLNASTAFDMAVGDYFLYRNTGSTGGYAVSGCWKVTAIAADKRWIEYATFYQYAAGPLPNLGGTNGGTITPIKTVLSAGNTTAGFQVSIDLGLLKYVVLTLDDTSGAYLVDAGISCSRGTTNCEIVGAHYVYSTLGSARAFFVNTTGSLNCINCCASNCKNGFSGFMSGGTLGVNGCYANVNFNSGYFLQGTAFQLTNSFCQGNAQNGAWCSGGSPASLTMIYAHYNQMNGIVSSDHGSVAVGRVINSGYAYGGFSGTNGQKDILLYRLASFIRSDAAPFVYGSSNIAPNVLSADGCFFVP